MRDLAARSQTRLRLLTSAAAGVMLMGVNSTAFAQSVSSVDLNLLDGSYTHLSVATAPIDGYQLNNSTSLSAVASDALGNIAVLNSLTAPGNTTLPGSYAMPGNTIFGEAYSNQATNTISASTTPAFADSSAIGNLQINDPATALTISASSTNASIQTEVEATDTAAGDRTLTGTVAMADNEIRTSSNGNTATNTLSIADAVSVSGTAANASVVIDTTDFLAAASTVTDLAVDANLVIANGQINAGTGASVLEIEGNTTGAVIGAAVEAVLGGSVALSDSTISSEARGNKVVSTINTGANAADIDATFAMANLQANANTDVAATTSNSGVVISTGYASGSVDGSTLTIDTADITASGFGNDSTQTLSLDANAINANDSGTAAQTVVSNVQLRGNSDTTATVSGSQIAIHAAESGGVLTDNTMTLVDANFDATAVGNRAVAQAVTLSGNTVGTGVQVLNEQEDDATSAVTASVSTMTRGYISVGSGDVADSTLTVESGVMRALAINNAAATTISIDANAMPLTENTGGVSTTYGFDNDTITAAFLTYGDQVTDGDTTATVSTQNAYFIAVEDNISGSTLDVMGNGVLAAGIGNDASNAITLSLNDVATVDGADVDAVAGAAALAAALTSQTVNGNADIRATASASDSIITIEAMQNVTGSSLSTDGNSVEAMAIGNRITGNTLTVDANALRTGTNGTGSTVGLGSGATGVEYFASNLVASSQLVNSANVTSELFSAGNASEIATYVADNVGTSTVSADDNVLRATTLGNSAVNGATVTAGSTLESSVGLANEQMVQGSSLIADIGAAGVEPGNVAGFNLNGTTTAGVFTATAPALTPEQQIRLQEIYGADPNFSYNAGTGLFTTTAAAGTTSLAVPAGLTAGAAQEGGVFVRIDNNVSDSTVSVAGNTTAGAVTGNSATNTVTVDANTLLEAGDSAIATASGNASAIASNMLLNTQEIDTTTVDSDVYGAFAIDTAADQTFGDSTLTVAGNTQNSSATGNTATSTLSVDATSLEGNSSLMNDQITNGTISALSDLWAYAPVAVAGSTVTIADNTNRATAIGNTGTNKLDLSGTNLSFASVADAAITLGDEALAFAAMYSDQTTNGTVTATVDTRIFNEHETDSTTTGIVDSTVAFDNNISVAEASANRVNNTVALDATNVGVTAALASEQDANAIVTATATASVLVDLTGTAGSPDLPAVDGSSVSVDGNITQAVANGNVSTNSMALNATNVTGDGTTATVDFGGVNSQVAGTYAVLNDQDNSGAISAQVTSVTYGTALNALDNTVDAMTGTMASVSGNSVLAQAAGNIGTSSLTVDALAADSASYALASNQTNTGAILASVTGASVGMTSIGAVTGSTSTVGGNSLGARAIGNASTNVISR